MTVTDGFRHFSARRALAALVLLLGACGGGGGGGGGDGPGGALNGGLGGRLYFDAANDYVEFDPRAGTSAVVLAGAAGAGSTPRADAGEFVRIDEDAAGNETVVIFGRDGGERARIAIDGRLTGFPKLSADGAFIALRRDFGASTVIFDRNGVIVRDLGGDVGRYAWLPDGRLAYIGGESVYITDNGFTPGPAVRSFAGQDPDALAVSADGSRFALTLIDTGGERALWVMNADGSGLRRLARSQLTLSNPTWSPDGATVAVVKGTSVPEPGVGGCPELWAVPSDATDADLSATSPAPALAVQQRENDGDSRDVCAFSPPEWRP